MAPLTNIRVGSFQPVDLLLLLLLMFCASRFVAGGFSLRISPLLRGPLLAYVLLLAVLLLLSLLSLRLDYYPILGASWIKQPGIFSLSKLLQLAAVVCGLFWAANILFEDRRWLERVMGAYWVAGLVCCVYAVASYALAVAVPALGKPDSVFGAYRNGEGVLRARGLFNEGGPFGVYLVSVLIIGLLRRQLTGKRPGRLGTAILLLAFLLAASKAGFFAAVFLILVRVTHSASWKRKVGYLAVSSVLLAGVAVLLDFQDQLAGYVYSYQNIDRVIAERGADLNVVAGRVAAFYLVPRMIAAHPWTGVGIGNYPLMRNDPNYLGILPSLPDVEDIATIGIPGVAAELGLPATAWLLCLLLFPYWRNRNKASVLAIAAAYQPAAHVFAVQLTFFYPWLVTACALAAGVHMAPARPGTQHMERVLP